MSNHVPDLQDVECERVLSGHPFYAREREQVKVFVERLRTAMQPIDFYELHRTLLLNFLNCQKWIDQRIVDKERVKEAIQAEKSAGRIEVVRVLSREIMGADVDLRAGRAILGVYRCLGDALVWHLLDYRRAAITLLGEGERVQRLADDAGLQVEVSEIVGLWESKGIVGIHTDITTCIQHGDVLSIEAWDPKRFRLTEVKARGAPDPDSPQMKRLTAVTRTLNEGFHPTLADGGPLQLSRCPVPLTSYLDSLRAAIPDARATGHTWFRPAPGLVVEVYDEKNPKGLSPQEYTSRHKEATETGGLESDRLSYSTSSRRLRDRLHSFSSLAPLAILPLPSDDVADLVVGAIDIVVTLDALRLERAFDDRGIDASVARGQAAGDSFLRATRGNAAVTVPATTREQVMLELLTIDSLIDIVDWMLEQTSRRGTDSPATTLDHVGEVEYWVGNLP